MFRCDSLFQMKFIEILKHDDVGFVRNLFCALLNWGTCSEAIHAMWLNYNESSFLSGSSNCENIKHTTESCTRVGPRIKRKRTRRCAYQNQLIQFRFFLKYLVCHYELCATVHICRENKWLKAVDFQSRRRIFECEIGMHSLSIGIVWYAIKILVFFAPHFLNSKMSEPIFSQTFFSTSNSIIYLLSIFFVVVLYERRKLPFQLVFFHWFNGWIENRVKNINSLKKIMKLKSKRTTNYGNFLIKWIVSILCICWMPNFELTFFSGWPITITKKQHF